MFKKGTHSRYINLAKKNKTENALKNTLFQLLLITVINLNQLKIKKKIQ